MRSLNHKSLPRAVAAQEKLLPFLLVRRSYPHKPRRVRMVRTHASFVFIAPPYVFKMKKAVNLDFLDFSTLEKRRHFCEREVELNRRLCADVYLGVMRITRKDGQFVFNGDGVAADYAVKMRLLSKGGFLKANLKRDEVQRHDLNRIARVLQKFYQTHPPAKEVLHWGRIDRLRLSTDENFRQTRRFVGRTISRPADEAIRAFTNQFYARHARVFAARVREQRIRDCHGDLRSEHVHLTPDALHIIDCIEFNDRFRYVDVANDIAFLAMDLDSAGRPDLARHFVAAMAKALEDEGMLRLMDFYKCYRAYVRGKVESLRSADAATDEEAKRAGHRARRYFRLALNYAVAGSQPMVLAVMGRVGSGKSQFARAFGEALGWPVFSSDRVRKELAGAPVNQRSDAAIRHRLYSTSMTRRTYAALVKAAEHQIASGRGVILDATFGRRAQREQLQKRFTRGDVALHFLEMQANDATIRRWLAQRNVTNAEASDARLEDFAMLAKSYRAPDELTARDLTVVQSRLPLAQQLRQALAALAVRRVNDVVDGSKG